jgi:MoaA/NifB/PqqE/SkfB family radical SAM enzyme
MENNSKTFCMHPFTGLATREDGAIKICCRSLPIDWIQNTSIENAWNNEKMKEVRRQILNNEKPDVCSPCFTLEDQGVESLRQRHIKPTTPESRILLYPNALDTLNDDYTMPFELPTIEIKLNNLCNLRCRMCNPLDSTSWNDWDTIEEFYIKENNYLVSTVNDLGLKKNKYIGLFDDSENWWKSFEKLLPYFRRVEFAGGEPLMDPYHYRILDMLKTVGNNIEIKYATNGTTLGISKNRTIHDYWPYFKSVAVNVSIDGIHDVYEYIRTNSKFKDIELNIKEMQEIPNVSRIVGAFTVQAGNVLQIAECLEYFIETMGIFFYSHRVSYPNILSAQVLPNELKKIAIDRLISVDQKIHTFKNLKKHDFLEEFTRRQIQDNINYLNSKDQSSKWNDFLSFNKKLDLSRNQGPIENIFPEFKPYV